MKREEMKKLAPETLDIVRKGYYKVNGKKVELQKLEKGEFISEVTLDEMEKDIGKLRTFTKTEIEVVKETTVKTLLREEGKVGVLNFASAYHPGGGFFNGSKAQEESLAYASNLYDTLKGNRLYEINKALKTKLYSSNMIVGNVEFFRDENYNLLETPKTVRVVTSPAVNMGEIIKRNESVEGANREMKGRMRKTLVLLAHSGCETIILGGFGCGVFKNDPKVVANHWKELLKEEKLEKLFERIVFAIYDRPTGKVGVKTNYDVFLGVLGGE